MSPYRSELQSHRRPLRIRQERGYSNAGVDDRQEAMDRRGGAPAGQVQVGRRCRQGADATLRRAVSSAGRAVALQAIGQRFDPSTAHHHFRDLAFSRVPIFLAQIGTNPCFGQKFGTGLVQDSRPAPTSSLTPKKSLRLASGDPHTKSNEGSRSGDCLIVSLRDLDPWVGVVRTPPPHVPPLQGSGSLPFGGPRERLFGHLAQHLAGVGVQGYPGSSGGRAPACVRRTMKPENP